MRNAPKIYGKVSEPMDGKKVSEQDEREKAHLIQSTDRFVPRWITGLSGAFTMASAICQLGIVVVVILFQSIVSRDGEVGMVPYLLGCGGALILSCFVIEFAQTRALYGFRATRENYAIGINALMVIPVVAVLSFVHPLAGLPILMGVAIGALGIYLVERFGAAETPWGILSSEAVSILSGRDARGLALSQFSVQPHGLSRTFIALGKWVGALLGAAVGSTLVSQEVLILGATLGLSLWSYWSVEKGLLYFSDWRFNKRIGASEPAAVDHIDFAQEDRPAGLWVCDLNFFDSSKQHLLKDISFCLEPGEVAALIGESGSGKTLLMRSLADPFAEAGSLLRGGAILNGQSLWMRSATPRSSLVSYLPETPLLMQASGADNLSCFETGQALSRAKWTLEQLVFDHETVEKICQTEDANRLPSMQKKALSLARMFLLSPQLYLFDRPEDGLGDAQVTGFCQRVESEARLGRTVLLISNNRKILEKCDRLFVMQDGRIIDYGPSDQVKERIATGWSRFISARDLATEDNLENWARSHFRRDGDETNRRNLCRVASLLLAYSCQNREGLNPGLVQFLFKHFEGHCWLHMIDNAPQITAVQIEKARSDASDQEKRRKNLLAQILSDSLDVVADSHLDGRIVKVKVATYDPRKSSATTGVQDDRALQ